MPLSVAITAISLVLGAWSAVGVHVKTPLVVMLAPVGASASKVNVTVWGGRSVSVALAVKLRSVLAYTTWLDNAARMGGVLGAPTTTVKLLLSESGGVPLSAAMIEIRLVLGPWAALGTQTKRPLAEMLAPAGAPGPRLKVMVCGG